MALSEISAAAGPEDGGGRGRGRRRKEWVIIEVTSVFILFGGSIQYFLFEVLMRIGLYFE